MATLEPTIGLEIHAELNTRTKMFCYSSNNPDEKHPNINVCPICMGHPGTLPTINQDAVEKVIAVGLALGGEISEFSQFDRKNYFYPDLPKGYQISQYEHPIVRGGHLDLEMLSGNKRIRIRRIHLEEDTGRLIHPVRSQMPIASADSRANRTSNGVHDKETEASLVDFNRAGVPLMELVTEPNFQSGDEVKQFGEKLQRILRYIGASDANMEKGQMRVEVNISLHENNSELGTKVEIKNINSFKFAADAIEYEVKRQTEILEKGEKIIQETRGWNELKGITFSQRIKEEAHDYRYFPEPDLPPLKLQKNFVETIRSSLPELPKEKRERFIREYGVMPEIASILTEEKSLADYFEEVASEAGTHDKDTPEKPKELIKTIAAFITGDFLRLLKETGVKARETRVTPENFAELILYVAEDKISQISAKKILEEMFRSGEDPTEVIENLSLWQISDSTDLEDTALHIISENDRAVKDYKEGKTASLQFLVGQVMKESRGKANPKMVQEIIKKLLVAIKPPERN